MSAGQETFTDLLKVSIYMILIWFASKFSRIVGLSAIIGEIIAGIALGPHGAGLLPDHYMHSSEGSHHLDIFSLIGHAGVSLAIFESGMHFDLRKVHTVGGPAIAIAVIGTFLPIVSGTLVVWLLGMDWWPHGVTAGVTMAPTSVGIALKLLMETNKMSSKMGQTVITAAFADDVLSLIAYSLLLSIGTTGRVDFVESILPGILGIVFLVVGALMARYIWPPCIVNLAYILSVKYDEGDKKDGKEGQEEEEESKPFLVSEQMVMVLMFILLFAYTSISVYAIKGSHLWGCFIAGMSFSLLAHPADEAAPLLGAKPAHSKELQYAEAHAKLDKEFHPDGADIYNPSSPGGTNFEMPEEIGVVDPVEIWTTQSKRIGRWLLRLFFSATVAFVVPVSKLFSGRAFGEGLLLGAIPCIGAKLVCGLWMGEDRWVIGWAMAGRAEFAYLIAQMALFENLIDDRLFAALIWALFLATITAPFFFKLVLYRKLRKEGMNVEQVVEANREARRRSQSSISIRPGSFVGRMQSKSEISFDGAPKGELEIGRSNSVASIGGRILGGSAPDYLQWAREQAADGMEPQQRAIMLVRPGDKKRSISSSMERRDGNQV